jgi:hypothetical protein
MLKEALANCKQKPEIFIFFLQSLYKYLLFSSFYAILILNPSLLQQNDSLPLFIVGFPTESKKDENRMGREERLLTRPTIQRQEAPPLKPKETSAIVKQSRHFHARSFPCGFVFF